ncbi:MAG: hypothetical protein KIT00_11200 [Rhodospirillales bacterium]|nr:hypothetical protein [Rhodospirillales bacterium]
MLGETLRNLVLDEAGGPAIEYGLIASLVAIAALAGLQALGLSVAALYASVVDAVDHAMAGVNKTL